MIELPKSQRDWFVWLALQRVVNPTPYLWGGDDPIAGLDCSGLVIDCGKAVGLFSGGYDATASGVFDHLSKRGKTLADASAWPGSLLFWGEAADPASIYHVGIYLNTGLMVEAGGGGSKTTDLAAAIKQNALVRIRPVSSRTGKIFYADPFTG